ncbi:MAG: hypothetical protein AAB676_17255 [Verrucomicrobiota bacterium]
MLISLGFRRTRRPGDILKASIVGNVITVSINGVEKARVTDDTYKTGNPGIGLFLHADGGGALVPTRISALPVLRRGVFD